MNSYCYDFFAKRHRIKLMLTDILEIIDIAQGFYQYVSFIGDSLVICNMYLYISALNYVLYWFVSKASSIPLVIAIDSNQYLTTRQEVHVAIYLEGISVFCDILTDTPFMFIQLISGTYGHSTLKFLIFCFSWLMLLKAWIRGFVMLALWQGWVTKTNKLVKMIYGSVITRRKLVKSKIMFTKHAHLDMSSDDIDPKLAEAVAFGLRHNPPHLKSLDLSKNGLADEGVSHIADGLKTNTILTALNLCENKIMDQGVSSLATAILSNNTIRTLNLNRNIIQPKGALVLEHLLLTHPTLLNITMEGNGNIEPALQRRIELLCAQFTLHGKNTKSNTTGVGVGCGSCEWTVSPIPAPLKDSPHADCCNVDLSVLPTKPSTAAEHVAVLLDNGIEFQCSQHDDGDYATTTTTLMLTAAETTTNTSAASPLSLLVPIKEDFPKLLCDSTTPQVDGPSSAAHGVLTLPPPPRNDGCHYHHVSTVENISVSRMESGGGADLNCSRSTDGSSSPYNTALQMGKVNECGLDGANPSLVPVVNTDTTTTAETPVAVQQPPCATQEEGKEPSKVPRGITCRHTIKPREQLHASTFVENESSSDESRENETEGEQSSHQHQSDSNPLSASMLCKKKEVAVSKKCCTKIPKSIRHMTSSDSDEDDDNNDTTITIVV
jgi:hypothetical protein